MTSPYLDRPLRPKHVVIAEILANMRDTYLIVQMNKGEPYFQETELGQWFDRVVRDLADGQYEFKDGSGPVAVLRISRDAPAEDVTEKVAKAVLTYLDKHDELYDEEGYLKRNAFLDRAWPEWDTFVRPGKSDPPEYEHEEFLEKREQRLCRSR
jgi:hypothetical protein